MPTSSPAAGCISDILSLKHNGAETLGPRQNGRHFPDDILKCNFLSENVSISIKISLKSVPKGPINDSALVQITAWRRSGSRNNHQRWLFSCRVYTSLGLKELDTQLYVSQRKSLHNAFYEFKGSYKNCNKKTRFQWYRTSTKLKQTLQ